MITTQNGSSAHSESHTALHESHHSRHVEHATDHSGHEIVFRDRFWVSLLLTIPVLLFSPMLQEWLGFRMPVFPGSMWIEPIFAVAVFIYGGLPFLGMALPEIRNRRPGMMLLISLAISVAFLYSLFTLFLGTMSGFFWEMATLIVIMLLGHWLEMRSVRQASRSLDELAALLPDHAERIQPDGSTEVIRLDQVHVGNVLLIRPGNVIPADGEIVEGRSDVNEAVFTGESKPVVKTVGDKLVTGVINGSGSLRLKVTAVGDDTALAGIMRLVAEAQASKSATQVLADKAAGWLFYIALVSALLTAVAWTLARGFDLEVVERVVTVLVIACPHALGLAIPLVVAISTTLGAHNGVLVRDRLALEASRNIDAIIFDKTGTLTEGRFGVASMIAAPGWDEDAALSLTASVEGDSEHLIARSIRRKAQDKELPLLPVSDFEAIKGRGIKAIYDGRPVFVGGPRLLEELKIELDERFRSFRDTAGARAQSVVYLVRDNTVAAAFSLADLIRPESRRAVERLKALGIEVAMLTGDSQAVAHAVAEELGIDTVFAEVLPEHKDQKVAELQQQGKRVAMVGDGINDAPALTRADVGIAIGSGTDVAIESAGIILVQSSPLDVIKVIELSRATYRKMIQNLIWATGYNVIAIPLAAGALALFGNDFLLSPALGAVFMSASTIIVALNAQLLRTIRFTTA